MKKIIFFSAFLAFGFTAGAQQIIPAKGTQQASVMVSSNLKQAIADWDQQITDINNDLLYYSKNYNKVFKTTGLYNKDNEDKFADFYEAYNYNFNDNVLKDPIIKGMPAPGPNLDYWNVCPNNGGRFDRVVGN